MHLKLAVSATALLLLVPPAARAGSPYDTNNSEEYVWLGSGLGLLLGGTIWSARVEPLSLAEIEALDPGQINSLDRNTMKPYRDDHAGDALAAAAFVLPLTLFTRSDMRDDAGTITVMWIEANLVSQGLVAVTKAAAERTRPFVYDPNAPMELKTQRDARLSFFSGHTTAAATNSFFMATVFSDYSTNRSAEIAVWSGAMLYSVAAGFFRVDSGHHFTTDTITGLVVGAAAGVLVPVMHRAHNNGLSVAPRTGSGTFGISATFSF